MYSARGSLWRKWDLHVHTPDSVLCNGYDDDFDVYAKKLFTSAVDSEIAAIGVTDYFGISGYKKLKEIQEKRLTQLITDDIISTKAKRILLLPNIELRLDVLVNNHRVNFHVLFSDEVQCEDIEENFIHELKVLYEGSPQASDDARKLSARTLEQIGSDLKDEHDFDGTDLYVGMMNAFVSHTQISEVLNRQPGLFDKKYLLAVVADEDLSKVSWNGQGHLTRKVLIQKSDFLFSSNPKTIQWGLGCLGNDSQDKYVKEFKSLKPCIHGSDAHNYEKLFKPDEGKYCWIKSDATFRGLKQAIYEAKNRIFIGVQPPTLKRIRENQSKFIDQLSINWVPQYSGHRGYWFKEINIELNPELIAVIGNKGAGKSALADIIAIGGNSYEEKQRYSFLNDKKFDHSFSQNFELDFKWFSQESTKISLNQLSNPEKKEGVKYLPQSHFEDICNEIDSSEKFRKEIEKVVFQHVPEFDRAGYGSFEELVQAKEKRMQAEINQLKDDLYNLIKDLKVLDEKAHPSYIKKIKSEIDEKKTILNGIEANPPEEISKPTDSFENNPISIIISQKTEMLNGVEKVIEEFKGELTNLNKQLIDIDEQIEVFTSLNRQISKTKENSKMLLSEWGIDVSDILSVKYKPEILERYKKGKDDRVQEIKTSLLVHEIKINNDFIIYNGKSYTEGDFIKMASEGTKKEYLKQKIEILERKLSEPQRKYQEYLEQLKRWQKRKEEIIGEWNKPDTLLFFKKLLSDVENDFQTDIKLKRDEVIKKSLEILVAKSRIKQIYDSIKKSIEKVLKNETRLIINHPIKIESKLRSNENLSSKILSFVNRRNVGSFMGKEDGDKHFHEIIKDLDIGNPADLKKFFKTFLEHLDRDHRSSDKPNRSILDQVNEPITFYNTLFSLDYIVPHYELRQGEKTLDTLSPGERGALLLIFYLILDRSDKPLIIDQPEDNLDNQSVAEILVPFIQQAKQRRQIIMITHNPNLAVVADAEQIIRVDIKKDNDNFFEFKSGSIENQEINKEIVDVLEGKMPAFTNRSTKYLQHKC